MKLTYKVNGNGYTIFDNGVPWIVQDAYIPFPADTLDESAKLHIESLLQEPEVSDELSYYELQRLVQTQKEMLDNMTVVMAELLIGGKS